jgi:hypothetical protein
MSFHSHITSLKPPPHKIFFVYSGLLGWVDGLLMGQPIGCPLAEESAHGLATHELIMAGPDYT